MPRLTGVYAVGILAAAGLMAGSQAASSTADSGLLGAGRHAHAITATVHFPGAAEGATSQTLLVGVPGSTDEIDDQAYLPATAVLRPANQVPTQVTIGASSLAVRFSPAKAGDYPVFLMAADDPMCHSQQMMNDSAGSFTLSQVGMVRVS
jgi:hypothetical protein